jgi:hypothetical protein
MIIDRARALGYCFGVVDRTGQVVGDRYVSSGEPIPQATNPVPYNFLERAGTPPAQWFVAPDGLGIDATHFPAVFARGRTGTITINVTNLLDTPSDADPVGGSTVTVTDAIPAGLTATSVSGPGWTCSGSGTRRCTRTDTLAPHASYPPITIAVNVGANAAGVVTNTPKYIAHGQGWANVDADPISVGVPADGDVSGTVPATLALTLGPAASFGAFTPGLEKDYTATTSATVVSTAADAALSVSEPGHLTNGAFSLASPLQADWAPRTWTGPVSNAVVPISLSQHIGANEPLRTGSYSTTLTWTLSTTTP